MSAGSPDLDAEDPQSGDPFALAAPEVVIADVRIELYGIARARAGVASVEIEADTLAGALRGLAAAVPGLRGEVLDDGGGLTRHFVASLNGERFVSDPETPLRSGDALLLLSSQAGG